MNSKAQTRAFLEVEQSITGQRWVERLDARASNVALAIAQNLDISELLARVLAARGVEIDEAAGFLDPKLRDLFPDPSSFTDMDKAAERLATAVEKGENVAIFGDYDVDGATSSALLFRFLQSNGLEPRIYIPDRIFEGYGPNPAAITELVEDGATLIVCVDCGSTSHEPIDLANQKGADVVVFDHHQVSDELPKALALVNPNRQDDLSGQGHLCAAGVVFVALAAINRTLRANGWYDANKGRNEPDLMNWLDLAALGTVCDVVPLKGVNRAFILRGLEVLRNQQNIGLAALARIARMDGPPSSYHLGFVIGPRINAGGRIGDAGLGARLLVTHDTAEAEDIAGKLNTFNSERQEMEARMLEEANAEAEREIGSGDGPAVLVTQSESWHAGVVGLLASRLKDRFHRPVFAIQFDGNGVGTGSGRSISGVDLGKAVRKAVDAGIVSKGGGHAMAAGITIHRDKLGGFRRLMEEMLGDQVTSSREGQVLKIDGALSARGANLELIDQLEHAGPYGAGHPQPIFAFPNHTLRFAKLVGKNHVQFAIASADGAQLKGISFRTADTELGQTLLKSIGSRLNFAGTIGVNFWQGKRNVQLRLIDAALSH